MIFELFLNCVDDLSTRWTDFRDGLTELVGALSAADPLVPTLIGFIDQAKTELGTIAAQRPSLAGTNNAATLIEHATPIFTDTKTHFTPIRNALDTALPDLIAREGRVSAAAVVTRSRLADLEAHINECVQELVEISTAEGQRANVSGIRGSVSDLSTYPVLTQDFGYGSGSFPSSGGTGGGGTPLGQMVERAFSAVLGLRPRLNDTKSFMSALNQSFVCEEVEGRTVCRWNQRGGVAVAELGGTITGAQASLYQRARLALDNALPLLDALTPLRADFDAQEVEAVRAIVRQEMIELVNEFGVEGGPRVERVDDLFALLSDPPNAPFNRRRGGFRTIDNGQNILALINAQLLAAFGSGELGRLGDVFGLTRDRVNTIEEERDLTNYLIVRDHIDSLLVSWLAFRPNFLGGIDNFLGTQLVLIQRSLAVIAESVDEVYFAMDSVFLGPAERKTTRIEFPANVAPPMFVDELFSWVHDYAADEAPSIIEDGGKRGVRAIVPTLRRLHDLVEASIGRIRHPGARHERVRRTIDEVVGHLDEAARLSGTIT